MGIAKRRHNQSSLDDCHPWSLSRSRPLLKLIALEVFASKADEKRRFDYVSVIAKSSPLFSE